MLHVQAGPPSPVLITMTLSQTSSAAFVGIDFLVLLRSVSFLLFFLSLRLSVSWLVCLACFAVGSDTKKRVDGATGI